MDYKRLILGIFLAVLIFASYFFIKGGKLIDIKKVELSQENICDYLKQFKSKEEVAIDLKDDFEKCFNSNLETNNNLNKKQIEIIKLEKNKDDSTTSTLSEVEKGDCLELESLDYSEEELFNSSTLKAKYGHCFEENQSKEEGNKNIGQDVKIDDKYFNLEYLCPLYQPIKDEKECNLIVDEFGRENCKVCKQKGY